MKSTLLMCELCFMIECMMCVNDECCIVMYMYAHNTKIDVSKQFSP